MPNLPSTAEALARAGRPIPAAAFAEWTGLPLRTVQKMLIRHELLGVKLGRTWLVSPREPKVAALLPDLEGGGE